MTEILTFLIAGASADLCVQDFTSIFSSFIQPTTLPYHYCTVTSRQLAVQCSSRSASPSPPLPSPPLLLPIKFLTRMTRQERLVFCLCTSHPRCLFRSSATAFDMSSLAVNGTELRGRSKKELPASPFDVPVPAATAGPSTLRPVTPVAASDATSAPAAVGIRDSFSFQPNGSRTGSSYLITPWHACT